MTITPLQFSCSGKAPVLRAFHLSMINALGKTLKDTRGKSRDGKKRSGRGRERDGTGTESRVIFRSFPTAISRPFPSLVSVPAVYHPVVRRLVAVPTVSRPTVCLFVPIPSRRSHTNSPIPHLTIIFPQLFTVHLPPAFSFPHHMTMYATNLDSAAVYFLAGIILFSIFLCPTVYRTKKRTFSCLKLVVC